MYKQESPFCIQVELTLGCNLACNFCGINGIGYGKQKHGLKFMTLKDASQIARNIAATGWTSRIEFARRGEPTLNPRAAEIIAAFRFHLPQHSLMMLSNGIGLASSPVDYATTLFNAGLNTLAVEEYEHAPFYKKMQQRLLAAANQTAGLPFSMYFYPNLKTANPHRRRKPSEQHLVFVQDISKAHTGTHSTLNNHGGYAAPLVQYNKPCAKPFREMSINYDGTITYCCINWGGEGKCGTAFDDIAQVWDNERFVAIRQHLLPGQRTFLTCKGCDHPSYRVGLLPDKKGQDKQAYPLPKRKAKRIIAEMEAEGYAVIPVAAYLKLKEPTKET